MEVLKTPLLKKEEKLSFVQRIYRTYDKSYTR
jgi:hypothetical protein